eukprot:1335485-Lingulodinium_polyedra.AAC.1
MESLRVEQARAAVRGPQGGSRAPAPPALRGSLPSPVDRGAQPAVWLVDGAFVLLGRGCHGVQS